MRWLAAVLALLCAHPALADTRAWDFRVMLEDREIGRHRFELRETEGGRELRSEARFDVRILRITAYRYEHEALERWRGDCLEALRSRTNDNGERAEVNWRSPGGDCAMSFAYWNPRVLAGGRFINAQTGEEVPVTVTARGEEKVEVRGRQVLAQRHRLVATGGAKLTIDLWYAGGEWVGLDSLTEGGRVLRYRLM